MAKRNCNPGCMPVSDCRNPAAPSGRTPGVPSFSWKGSGYAGLSAVRGGRGGIKKGTLVSWTQVTSRGPGDWREQQLTGKVLSVGSATYLVQTVDGRKYEVFHNQVDAHVAGLAGTLMRPPGLGNAGAASGPVSIRLTPFQASELDYKLNTLEETPELAKDLYGLTQDDVGALVASIPRRGGVWRIDARFLPALVGEVENQLDIDEGNADYDFSYRSKVRSLRALRQQLKQAQSALRTEGVSGLAGRAKDWGYVYEWCDPKTKRPTRRVPRTPGEWARWNKAMMAVESARARGKLPPKLRCW